MAAVLNKTRCFCLTLTKRFALRSQLHTTKNALQNNRKFVAFDDPRVKSLLRRMTGENLNKILASRREQGSGSPSYKLLTNEELSKAEAQIEEDSEKYLNMPAVMEERQDCSKVLKKRPQLDGYSECNIIFTDISHGTTNRDRHIVVSEPDGTLCQANWNERDRMNFTFFQQEGQSYELPKVLEEENLQNPFDRGGHVDVLDLVCCQCEPDSPDYIRVHRQTYEDILSRRSFDLLRSTRHFGGMVYHLTKENRLTWLLHDMLKRDLISDACNLVQLYHILHPNSKSAQQARNNDVEGIQLIQAYVKAEGPYALLDFLQDETAVA